MGLVDCSEFEAYIKQLLASHHVPGVGIAVVQNGTIACKGFGKACLDPPTAFSQDSLVCIGSCSKSLTAAVIACLAADESVPGIQLEKRITQMLPEAFAIAGNDHDDVTLIDILSHRTGMPPHEFSLLGKKAAKPDTVASITRNLRNLPTAAVNRKEFIYCNMMYSMATHLAEVKTEKPFAQLLDQYLFGPLGMSSSALFQEAVTQKDLIDRMASGYHFLKHERSTELLQYSDSLEGQGAGGVFTSVSDMAKFIKAMIHQEEPISSKICQSLVEKRISQAPHGLDTAEAPFYGLGWDIQDYGEHILISHDGGEVGYQSTHFFIPALKFGGVIHSNSDNAGDLVSQIKFLLVDAATTSVEDVLASLAEAMDDDAPDDEDEEDDDAAIEEEVRRQLTADARETSSDLVSFLPYVGRYWHAGYRELQVMEHSGTLLVDGTDRSLAFQMSIEHVSNQAMFLARLKFLTGEPDMILPAMFEVQDQEATRLGIKFEGYLDDYIWFERIAESA